MADDAQRRGQLKALLLELLDATFTLPQLDQFCWQHFPEAYAQVHVAGDKTAKARLLINHCAVRHGEIDALVAQVAAFDYRQSARFRLRLASFRPFPDLLDPRPDDHRLVVVEVRLREAGARGPAPGTHVVAWLRYDDDDFDLLGPEVQPIPWPEDGPRPVTFELWPRRTGLLTLRCELYHGTCYLGCTPSVMVAARPDAPRAAPLALDATITLTPLLPPPDLLIRFHKTSMRDGATHYAYRVSSLVGGLCLTPLGDIPLADLPGVMQPVLAELDGLARRATPPALAELHATLARRGRHLYTELIPAELDTVLRRLPPERRAVQIISDAATIPWEMLCLEDEGGESIALAQRFALTHWRADAGPAAAALSLSRLYLLVGKPVIPLPGAEQEARDLAGLLGARAAQMPPAAVWGLLAEADFDALHIVSHGYEQAENADQSYIELGQGQPPLRASDLSGCRWSARRPLLFVNACNVGRAGVGLTGLGGWAHTALAHADAGAFVGANWQATDGTARLFAVEFYRHLLAGETIGEAARAARNLTRCRPDPTWLCYAVYAHPNARIHPGIEGEEGR